MRHDCTLMKGKQYQTIKEHHHCVVELISNTEAKIIEGEIFPFFKVGDIVSDLDLENNLVWRLK